MKTKKYWVMVAVVICCAVVCSVRVLGISYGEQSQLDRYRVSTLQGLTAVRPVVLLMTPGKKGKLGSVTESNLQTRVELALRKSGIKIFPRHKEPTDLNTGTLGVAVHLNDVILPDSNVSLYAVVVYIELRQAVKLARNTEIHTDARTWPMFNFEVPGINGSDTVEQAIKNKVDHYVNEFINDYLAANPQTRGK